MRNRLKLYYSYIISIHDVMDIRPPYTITIQMNFFTNKLQRLRSTLTVSCNFLHCRFIIIK